MKRKTGPNSYSRAHMYIYIYIYVCVYIIIIIVDGISHRQYTKRGPKSKFRACRTPDMAGALLCTSQRLLIAQGLLHSASEATEQVSKRASKGASKRSKHDRAYLFHITERVASSFTNGGVVIFGQQDIYREPGRYGDF